MLMLCMIIFILCFVLNIFHNSLKFINFNKNHDYIRILTKLSDHKKDDFNTNCNKPISTNYDSMKSIKNFIKFPVSIILGYSFYPPIVCRSEKGAFEMDAEFYIRNLLGKNENLKDKIIKNQPIYKSPRIMNSLFTFQIMDIVINSIVITNNNIKDNNIIKRNEIIQFVSDRIPFTLKYFKTFAPITIEDITDQYYFDMILYLYYIQAGILIKSSENRVKLRTLIGDNILQLMISKYTLNNIIKVDNENNIIPIYNNNDVNKASNGLIKLSLGIIEILEIFKRNGIILDYEFDSEDLIDIPYAISSFKDNLPISFQITIKEPANIIGFLEGISANTFFHPEIIGTTITSLATKLGYRIRFDDYLMDNYYRTENRDIQAQDILLEFGLYFL